MKAQSLEMLSAERSAELPELHGQVVDLWAIAQDLERVLYPVMILALILALDL